MTVNESQKEIPAERGQDCLACGAENGPRLVWFVWLYGISTFVGYLMPNPFLCK